MGRSEGDRQGVEYEEEEWEEELASGWIGRMVPLMWVFMGVL